MKKLLFLLLTNILLFEFAMAQNDIAGKPKSFGRSHQVALSLNTPLSGYLKDISNMGVSTAYFWSRERFGKLALAPSKPLGLILNAGVDYFFGEQETYLNQTVKYGATTYIHTNAGVIYHPCSKGNLVLTGGPVLELYKGDAEFGLGTIFSGSIYLFQCKSVGISPNLSLMKLRKSEAVLYFGVGINYAF